MQFSFRRVPDGGNLSFLLVSGPSTTPTVRAVRRALIVARVRAELLLPPSRLGSADLLPTEVKPTGVKQGHTQAVFTGTMFPSSLMFKTPSS